MNAERHSHNSPMHTASTCAERMTGLQLLSCDWIITVGLLCTLGSRAETVKISNILWLHFLIREDLLLFCVLDDFKLNIWRFYNPKQNKL